MSALGGDLVELREQLGRGVIQRAYTAIIAYMSGLRTHFAATQGDKSVSALYQGYLDMTYFALFPPALKSRGLKLAVVFDYEAFRFRIWLAARNREVQRTYWRLLRDAGWSGYRLIEPTAGVDAIVEHDVADGLGLTDPEALTTQIEQGVAEFLGDIEPFLERHDRISYGRPLAGPSRSTEGD